MEESQSVEESCWPVVAQREPVDQLQSVEEREPVAPSHRPEDQDDGRCQGLEEPSSLEESEPMDATGGRKGHWYESVSK